MGDLGPIERRLSEWIENSHVEDVDAGHLAEWAAVARGLEMIVEGEPFGQQMRRDRLAQGKTLRAVAGEAGVSPAYLSDMEKGRRDPPPENTARRIAAALGVDAEAFVLRATQHRVPEPYRARIARLEAALAFARSVILSGEPWTAACERIIGGALHPAKDDT